MHAKRRVREYLKILDEVCTNTPMMAKSLMIEGVTLVIEAEELNLLLVDNTVFGHPVGCILLYAYSSYPSTGN